MDEDILLKLSRIKSPAYLTKGPVALGRIFVYFAKKTVNKCCRRVRPTFFALTKFCPTLTNFKEAATKNRGALGLAEFLSGDFIVPFCLFSVTKSISTFHTPLTHEQVQVPKHTKLKSTCTSVQQAWENFARFLYQHFNFPRFQGAAGVGPYMSLLTDEQEYRGSSFNYYGSQIFPSQIINEEQSSISPKLTSSIADTSAAAAAQNSQNKKQYETLIRREVLRVAEMDIWKGQTIWLTF